MACSGEGSVEPAALRPVYLEVGDPVADMGWRDPQGAKVSLYQSSLAGRLTAIFVCPSAQTPGAGRQLRRFADRAAGLRH